MNVIVQPISLLVCYLSIRNLALAVKGRIGYAGKGVPESDLQKYSDTERRALLRHCVLVSATGLLMFGSASFACVWPLLLLAVESNA
jgi:hypothetical protein